MYFKVLLCVALGLHLGSIGRAVINDQTEKISKTYGPKGMALQTIFQEAEKKPYYPLIQTLNNYVPSLKIESLLPLYKEFFNQISDSMKKEILVAYPHPQLIALLKEPLEFKLNLEEFSKAVSENQPLIKIQGRAAFDELLKITSSEVLSTGTFLEMMCASSTLSIEDIIKFLNSTQKNAFDSPLWQQVKLEKKLTCGNSEKIWQELRNRPDYDADKYEKDLIALLGPNSQTL